MRYFYFNTNSYTQNVQNRKILGYNNDNSDNNTKKMEHITRIQDKLSEKIHILMTKKKELQMSSDSSGQGNTSSITLTDFSIGP